MARPGPSAPPINPSDAGRGASGLRRRRWSLGIFCAIGALTAGRGMAAEPSPTGRTVVTYWEKWVGPEGRSIRAVVDAFNRSQDRIFVECLTVSPIDRKTLVATAGGDPPDIAGLYTQNIASFADAEALMPLDDFMRRDGTTPEAWLDRYYPVYARICQHGGHAYGVIATPAMILLHWNKTLFREAGLDPEQPPRTVGEMDEFARKLTKHDPKTGALTQVGFLPQEPGWWPWAFCEWFGGKIFDGNRVTLTDPRNIAAMRWVASFSQEYGAEALTKFASGFAGQMNSPESGFFSGKVAMVFQGVWYNNYIREYKPGLDYGVAGWPEAAPGITDFGVAESDVLVIPRGAKHPQAAWEFLKYIGSNNPQARSRAELKGVELLCYLQEKNSPLRVWSPFFANHHPHPYIGVFRRLSASPDAVAVPDIGIWTEVQRELLDAFTRVRLLMSTPEEALGEAQRRLQLSWDRHRRSLELHGQVPPGPPAEPASP